MNYIYEKEKKLDEALEKLGAEVELSDGMIITKGKLKGAPISFEKSSVGATGNTLMAAVTAEGTTIIKNAAQEPDIKALCIFLNIMGAEINKKILELKNKKNIKISDNELINTLYLKTEMIFRAYIIRDL